MAPIAAVAEEELPVVIRRMEERIREEATPGEAVQLWTAAYLLMGLRLDAEVAGQLLQGVRAMKESTTYQAILREGREEGRAEEAQRILLRQGTKRFGPPSEQVRATIEGIAAIERLELLSDRLLDVESWAELLAE